MRWLIEIMRKAESWRYGVGWTQGIESRILWHAQRLGLVYRGSVTQVHWTDRGCELARKYGSGLL